MDRCLYRRAYTRECYSELFYSLGYSKVIEKRDIQLRLMAASLVGALYIVLIFSRNGRILYCNGKTASFACNSSHSVFSAHIEGFYKNTRCILSCFIHICRFIHRFFLLCGRGSDNNQRNNTCVESEMEAPGIYHNTYSCHNQGGMELRAGQVCQRKPVYTLKHCI